MSNGAVFPSFSRLLVFVGVGVGVELQTANSPELETSPEAGSTMRNTSHIGIYFVLTSLNAAPISRFPISVSRDRGEIP